MSPPLSAYVDESMRIPPGLYLMAAVLVAPAQADDYRDGLRGLLYRRQRRLHWRDENDRRRAQLITALGALQLTGAMVIGAGLKASHQERARRKCMERLLWELGQCQVGEVIFERRHRELDSRDKELVAALQGRHVMPSRLHLAWQAPEAESLLWLPDIMAGAASMAEAGEDRYWKECGSQFIVHRLDVG